MTTDEMLTIPKNVQMIDSRVNELERQIWWLKHMIGTMMLTVIVLIGVAAAPIARHSMEITSPDGNHAVVIKAGDTGAGVWVTSRNNELINASVIGDNSGGYVQLRDGKQFMHTYSADVLGR